MENNPLHFSMMCAVTQQFIISIMFLRPGFSIVRGLSAHQDTFYYYQIRSICLSYLTLTALKYVFINYGDQMGFSI